MKEDLKNFQSQNTITVCSILGLMVLATITQPLEGKFFAKSWNISIGYCCLIGTSITDFLAWFYKSGSDFNEWFEPKSKWRRKEIKLRPLENLKASYAYIN